LLLVQSCSVFRNSSPPEARGNVMYLGVAAFEDGVSKQTQAQDP
jgi:hypothetical protein